MSMHDVIGQDAPEASPAVHVPLSYTQQQLWFAEQIDPDQSLYTEALAVRIRGPIEAGIIEQAIGEVVRRHEALRTIFPLVDGRAVQQVLPPDTPLMFTQTSVTDVPAPQREQALSQQVTGFVEQPMDLTRELLTRVLLVQVSPDDHVLVMTLHHLVCDGLSGSVLFQELGELYDAFIAGHASPLSEPELQYADFTEWERALYQSGHLDEDIDFWRERLAGVQAVLELPARKQRPRTKSVRGVRRQYPLANAAMNAELSRFCRDHSVSLYAVTLAAWAATVSRYTGQQDLVFGTLAANRARSELENVVGNFTNTLPMRIDVTGNPTFLELIGRTTQTSEEALEHGLLALGKIIELISPRRDPSRNALIQHLFLTSGQPASDATWGQAALTPYDITRNRGRLDTIVEVEQRGDELVSWAEYDTQLFDDDEIEQLMHHFANVLAEWLVSPACRLSDLRLLDPAELESYLDRPSPAEQPVPGQPPMRIVLNDSESTVAHILAAAVQRREVILCGCDASTCLCPALEATDLTRIAGSLASALWSSETTDVRLSAALPLRDRVLLRLSAAMSAIAATVTDRDEPDFSDTRIVVVTDDELGEVLDAPPGRIAVLGAPPDRLENWLTTSDFPVLGLAGHPDVLGPYAIISYWEGRAQAMELLPHTDAIVLDAYGHVPPLGVPGHVHLRATVTGQFVRTALVARRHGNGVRLCFDPGADTDAGLAEGATNNPLYELVHDLWCQALGVPAVAYDDDFFLLGGHSMVSARLIENLRETLQVDVPLRMLFSHSALGAFVEELQTAYPEIDDAMSAVGAMSEEEVALLLQTISEDDRSDVAVTDSQPGRFPLTSAQLQIWMMEYLRGAGITYTIPLEFKIAGPLDVDLLRQSILRVIDRHDMLRVTVEMTEDGEPVQIVHDAINIDIPFTDLTAGACGQLAEDIRRQIGYHEFSLQDGPLLAAHIVRHGPEQHTLYIVFHHLAMDERSMTLFMEELSAFYTAQLHGTAAPAELKVQIGDYCRWEKKQLSNDRLARLQAFWRSRLDGIPELVLPTDFPRPETITFQGEFLYRPRERKLFDEVADLAGRQQVTPFVVFTAATALLLHRLSHQDQFIIGMPTDSRGMPGSNELIGCFINVLPIRVDCTGSPTFAEFMRRLRDEVVAGYDHRSLPLSGIVNALGITRSLDRLPLFQVVVELQAESWMPFALPGCSIEFAFINHGTARYDLAFHAMAKPESFDICVEVNNTIFTFDTGYHMLDELTALVRQVIEDPDRPLTDYVVEN